MTIRAGAGPDHEEHLSPIEARIAALEAGGGGGGAQLGYVAGQGETDITGDTDVHNLLVLEGILIDGPIEIVATGVVSGSAASPGNLYTYFAIAIGDNFLSEEGWQPTTIPADLQAPTDPNAQHPLLIVDHFDPANTDPVTESGTYDITLATTLQHSGDGIAISSHRMWAKAL